MAPGGCLETKCALHFRISGREDIGAIIFIAVLGTTIGHLMVGVPGSDEPISPFRASALNYNARVKTRSES